MIGVVTVIDGSLDGTATDSEGARVSGVGEVPFMTAGEKGRRVREEEQCSRHSSSLDRLAHTITFSLSV